MIWVGLDVHKRFSRMGSFDPARGVQKLVCLPGPRRTLSVLFSVLTNTPSREARGKSSGMVRAILDQAGEPALSKNSSDPRMLVEALSWYSLFSCLPLR